MIERKKLLWLRSIHRRKEVGRGSTLRSAVVIREARQGTRQDVIEVAIDRKLLADRGLNVGDRVGFAVDPDDANSLYIAKADDGLGYTIGRSGRYATRIAISGRRARAIWHMIGRYQNVEDMGNGVFCIRKTKRKSSPESYPDAND